MDETDFVGLVSELTYLITKVSDQQKHLQHEGFALTWHSAED